MKKIFRKLKGISFHPKAAAVVDLVVGVGLVYWITKISDFRVFLIWAGVRLATWVILAGLCYYPSSLNRFKHFAALAVFFLGALNLLIFIEWAPSWQTVAGVFVLFPVISFWLIPARETELAFTNKTNRRFNFMMVLFGLTGIVSGISAIPVFQLLYMVPGWTWVIITSIISTVVAVWWWMEYGIAWNKQLALAGGLWFLLNLEACLVAVTTPLGYLALGLIFVWVWYIMWLLVRFGLTSEGVNWKKQRWFLIINTVAIIAFMVFGARWR